MAAAAVATCFCCMMLWINQGGFCPRSLSIPSHSKNATMVTALYNINRADRPFSMYMPWMKCTVQMPLPLVFFCQDRHIANAVWSIRRSRGLENSTIVVMESSYPLEYLSSTAQQLIFQSSPPGKENYQEWKNKDYIMLQFSKFRWASFVVSSWSLQHPSYKVECRLIVDFLLKCRSIP